MGPRPRRVKQHGDSSENHEGEKEVVNGSTSRENESESQGSSTLYSLNPTFNIWDSKLTPNSDLFSNTSPQEEQEDDGSSIMTTDESDVSTSISDQRSEEQAYRESARERVWQESFQKQTKLLESFQEQARNQALELASFKSVTEKHIKDSEQKQLQLQTLVETLVRELRVQGEERRHEYQKTSNVSGNINLCESTPIQRHGSNWQLPTNSASINPIVRAKHLACDVRGKCPRFSGQEDCDFNNWWSSVNAFLKQYDMVEIEKVKVINAALEDKARDLIVTIDENDIDTVDKLYQQLKATFGYRSDRYGELLRCKQKVNESFKSYAIRLSIAAKQAKCVGETYEKICLQLMRENATQEYRKHVISLPKTMTFDQVVEHVLDIENSGLIEKPAKRRIDVVASMDVDEIDQIEAKKARIEPMEVIANQIQYLVEQNRRQEGGGSDRTRRKKGLICFHCAKDGHTFNECNSATKKDLERIKKLLKDKKLDFQSLKQRNEQYHRELGNLNSQKTMAHKSGHPSSN